jgi:hypothetical protein
MRCLKKFVSWVRKLDRAEKVSCPLLLVVLIFLLTVALAPVHYMKEADRLVRHDSLFSRETDSVCLTPDISALAREKVYVEALLKLAATDSIQLSVNLSDSAVCLYMTGVKIHQTRIGEFRQDRHPVCHHRKRAHRGQAGPQGYCGGCPERLAARHPFAEPRFPLAPGRTWHIPGL